MKLINNKLTPVNNHKLNWPSLDQWDFAEQAALIGNNLAIINLN